jgi:radical SAM protein with 4Fe4S-binding SPASM domain
MGVECKLNYAMASGIQSKPYQLSKIYKTYVDVYKEGLWEWEYNTKQLMMRLSGRANSCPQNRNCDAGIRSLNPEGDYYSCGSIGDDREYPINFHKEVIENGPIDLRLKREPELQSLKMECYSCNLFEICNGCRKTIKDMKVHNMVDDHCALMKTLEEDILRINQESSVTTIDLNKKTVFKYESVGNSSGPQARKKPRIHITPV